MNVIIYILATLVVLSTSIILATNFKVKYYADKIIIVGLFFLVQIVLSSLFLGVVVKRLYPPGTFCLSATDTGSGAVSSLA